MENTSDIQPLWELSSGHPTEINMENIYGCEKRHHKYNEMEYKQIEQIITCPHCLLNEGILLSQYEVKRMRG